MARFVFPANPELNDEILIGSRTFRWDGSRWKFVPPGIAFARQEDIEQETAQAISELKGEAPELLDSIEELAAALGNDHNFHQTMANSLNAKADLVDGLVPANQLPSFVDDVLEFADLSSFPGAGDDPAPEQGKIYVALDSNKTYRWSGSQYVEISPGALPNDAQLDITTGTGLSGSGFFTANADTDVEITLQHGDTSSQASVDNTGTENVIKSISLDDFGHVTSIDSAVVESGSVSETYTGTLTSAGWSGSDPLTQTVAVTGLLATDNPTIDITFVDNYNTDTATAIEWTKIYRITTQDDQITAYAVEQPLVDIPIQIKVVR